MSDRLDVFQINSEGAGLICTTLVIAIELLEQAKFGAVGGAYIDLPDGSRVEIATDTVIDRLRETMHALGGPS